MGIWSRCVEPPTKPPPGKPPPPPPRERQKSSDSFPAVTPNEAEHIRKLLHDFAEEMRKDLTELETALKKIQIQSDQALAYAKTAEQNSQEMNNSLDEFRGKLHKTNERITKLSDQFVEQITNSADRRVTFVKQETDQDVRIAVLEAEIKKKNEDQSRSTGLKSGTLSGTLAGIVTYGIIQAVQYLLSNPKPLPTLVHWLPWWW